MDISYFKLKAKVQLISDLVHIERKTKPDLYKRVITLETSDGQILFPEIRNNRLKLLERENITVGSNVEVEYSFQGSEKNGKIYNNIYINSILKL